MIIEKFKEVFDLSNQLQEKNYKKEYNELSKIDKNIGTFEDYIENKKKELNREIPEEKRKIIDEIYISKDNIQKDILKFDLYLFHLKHTSPIEFDKNYKVLPLKQKDVFEYGAVVSLEDEKGFYNISGIFGGVEDDKNIAIDKYNQLKNKINNESENELLDDIRSDILMQINK